MEKKHLKALKLTTACLTITLGLISAAQANETTIYSYYGKNVTAHDIISHFVGDCATSEDPVECRKAEREPRTRGIRIHSEQRKTFEATKRIAKRVTPTPKKIAKAAPKSAPAHKGRTSSCPKSGTQVALPITFALNSAILEAVAYTKLRQMADAMNSAALGSCKFAVEGHTDASGGDALNLALSKKRAYAVREFLVSMQIDAARLKPIGKGETEPLPKKDPHAAENRRVQFRIVQN